MQTENKTKTSITVYLILAYGITWLCWVPALLVAAKQGYVMPNFNTYQILFESGFQNAQHLWLGILFSFAPFGPLIGSIVATKMDGGKEGLAALWQSITKWKVGARWYLTVLLVALLMPALPVGVFALVGGLASSFIPVWIIAFSFVLQLFTSGLGEEPGWRGFLYPRLSRQIEGENQVWLLGLIWAIWHYPLVILQTLPMLQGATLPQVIITIITSLAGMTMSQIGISFIYAWLYNQTKSVFLAIVFHALTNVLSFWIPSLLAQPQAVTILVALMPWAIVVIMQKRLGKENFPGQLET